MVPLLLFLMAPTVPHHYPHLALAAWIIHPGMLVPTPPCHGFTQVHGHHGLVNSYWAKLQSLHALLLAESNIFVPHTICNLVLSLLDVTIKVYSTKSSNLTLTYLASLNMLTSSVLSSRVHYLCSIQFTFCYVVGHQDNLMFEDLPLIIHLNVQADTMAKQAICILVGNDTVSILLPLPGKQWAFLANSIPVSSNCCWTILDN